MNFLRPTNLKQSQISEIGQKRPTWQRYFRPNLYFECRAYANYYCTWIRSAVQCRFFWSQTETFLNDRKKLSQFCHNVWKYRAIHIVTASFNTTMVQMTRDSTFGEFVPRLGISATFGEKFGELSYLGIF